MTGSIGHLARAASVVAVALVSMTSTPVQAQAPTPSVYVGFDAGAHLVVTDWDLMGTSEVDRLLSLGHGGAFTFRVGAVPFWAFSVEAFGTLVTAESEADAANHVLRYGVAALIHPLKTDWSPHLSLGGGGYTHLSGDVGPDSDFLMFLGLGLRGMVNEHVGIRLDFQWNFSDSFEDAPAHNAMLTLGIDAFLWRPPLDTDGDGVGDSSDACPQVAGEAWANGCPDSDGDGVADAADKCPKKAGPKDNSGCPAPADQDKDGIPDAADKCPKAKGPASLAGCPDTDRDGVADREDMCPAQPGPVATKGCPDADGDGVGDEDDKCPKVKGVVEKDGCPLDPDADRDGIADSKDMCPAVAGSPQTAGCPDRDRDGVADDDDDCPDTPGVKEAAGCVPKALKRFTGNVRGIYFDAGKATIRKRSFNVLNAAAKVLAKFPKLNMRIEGHTDDQGSAASNATLSHDRAKAVRTYLIDKGVAAARLTAVGIGEGKPVANNKTSKGRAKNRRIEFKIVAK